VLEKKESYILMTPQTKQLELNIMLLLGGESFKV